MEDKSVICQLQNELSIGESEVYTLDGLTAKWAQYFNNLIESDFHKLVSLLYRVDVSENKLKQVLKDNPDENAGRIIALLVIERLLQKIRSRAEHRSRSADLPDNPHDEEW
jgi:hypothetical protein